MQDKENVNEKLVNEYHTIDSAMQTNLQNEKAKLGKRYPSGFRKRVKP